MNIGHKHLQATFLHSECLMVRGILSRSPKSWNSSQLQLHDTSTHCFLAYLYPLRLEMFTSRIGTCQPIRLLPLRRSRYCCRAI